MASEKRTFTGADGQQLAARYDRPDGEIRAHLLFAHCFTCGKDLSATNRIAEALSDEGIALFRFDFTGLGMSDGEFANTNFSSNVQDLVAAYHYMTAELEAPQIICGHSLGGTASLLAAAQLPDIEAIVTIGAPCSTTNIFKQFEDQLETIERDGIAHVQLAGRPFTIKRQFIEDAREQTVLACVAEIKRPLLIMHSPLDETVPVEHARHLYEAAMHPKSFISLDEADHLLLKDPADSAYVARILSAWVSRYAS